MGKTETERVEKQVEKTARPETAAPEQEEFLEIEAPAPLHRAVISPAASQDDPAGNQARFLADAHLRSRREAGLRQRFVGSLQQHFGNRHVQRVLAERAKLDLQRRETDGSLQAGQQSAAEIAHQRSGGMPLPSTLQNQMESAFGTDFSQVRLHTGPEAQALSESLAAQAFTSGSDIWLANANDANNADLLAHELTHVIQQGGQPAPGGQALQVSEPGDPAEEQAEFAARMVSQPEIGENYPGTDMLASTIPAFQREEQTSAPVAPTLTPEQKVVVRQDVENIVAILTAGDPDAEQQAAIIGTMRNYQQMDTDYQNSTGYTGTAYLDYFLVRLKIASVLHSRMWPLESETVNAFDDLWYRLQGSSLEEFRAIVSSSQAERATGPEAKDVESFAQTMGKQEAMGVWGMLKGMGQGLAGLSDAGAKALTKAMRAEGVDVSDPASISDWLGKQYDISGNFMFGEDWGKKDDLALGMNAAEIGTKGGGVVWSLVMIGSGKAATAEAKAALVALGVAGNLDAIDKCNTNIANIIGRLQKVGKLNASDLLSDPDFISESAKLAANIFGIISAGAGTDEEISNSIKLALSATGRILDSGQAVALVNKLYAISASNLDPDAKNKASADAMVELIQVSVSIVESAGSEKEEVSGVDENTGGQTTPQNHKAEAHTEAPAKSIESEQKEVVKKEFEYKAGGPSGLEVEDTSGPIGNREGWNKHIEGFQTQDTAKLSAETMKPTMGEKSNEEGGTEHHTNMNFHEYSEAEAAIGLRIDWDPQAGRPRLVSYNFTAEAAAVPSQASDRSFHQEKRLKGESAQSKEKEYLNSGWEKGHLAQREAGKVDPNIDSDLGITPTGEDVERSLDVLTNVVPMTPALNKGQEWRSAERRTAKYAEDEGYVTVEIIPIYDVNPPRLQMNGTPIPRQILRIIKSGPTGRILESQFFENK